MSNPSFSNIDRWLFELFEGNLTPEQEAQLKNFIMLHPELDIDFNAWEDAFIRSGEIEFTEKSSLQKRRSIGLYMSLGICFILGLIAVGILSQFTTINGAYVQDRHTVDSGIDSSKCLNSGKLNKKDEPLLKEDSPTNTSNRPTESVRNLSFSGGSKIPILLREVGDDFISEMALLNSLKMNNKTDADISHNGFNNPISNERIIAKLQTKKLKPFIGLGISENTSVRSVINSLSELKKITKSTYHRSLSVYVHKLGRALGRLLNNPITLRNQNDPYYHVPGMQATDINFGAVGTLSSTRIQTVSRVQWLGMGNQQFINQLSVDGYSHAMRGGVGFQINQNYYADGSIQNYHATLTYSPKFTISRDVVLEPSVRFKMGSKQLNIEQINAGETVEFNRMNEEQFSTNTQFPTGKTLWYRDLGLGLMVNTRWFFAGIQQDNLFRHFVNIFSQNPTDPKRAPKHFVAFIGSDYKSIRQNVTISPYLVYQREDQLSEAWGGFNFRVYWLTFGGAISSKLDPAVSAGIKLKNLMLYYNLDLTHSSMLNKQVFSHQFTLRFTTKTRHIGRPILN